MRDHTSEWKNFKQQSKVKAGGDVFTHNTPTVDERSRRDWDGWSEIRKSSVMLKIRNRILFKFIKTNCYWHPISSQYFGALNSQQTARRATASAAFYRDKPSIRYEYMWGEETKHSFPLSTSWEVTHELDRQSTIMRQPTDDETM